MKPIHVVVDTGLPRETDEAARGLQSNRSALVRVALREHPVRLKTRALEESDRAGYQRVPQNDDASLAELEPVWPPE